MVDEMLCDRCDGTGIVDDVGAFTTRTDTGTMDDDDWFCMGKTDAVVVVVVVVGLKPNLFRLVGFGMDLAVVEFIEKVVTADDLLVLLLLLFELISAFDMVGLVAIYVVKEKVI